MDLEYTVLHCHLYKSHSNNECLDNKLFWIWIKQDHFIQQHKSKTVLSHFFSQSHQRLPFIHTFVQKTNELMDRLCEVLTQRSHQVSIWMFNRDNNNVCLPATSTNLYNFCYQQTPGTKRWGPWKTTWYMHDPLCQCTFM